MDNMDNDSHPLDSKNKDPVNNSSGILLNANESEMDAIDESAENDTLLDNDEIEEIIAKLPDENPYMPETSQTVATYIQVVDKLIAMEEVLESNLTLKELGFLKKLLKEYKLIYKKSKKQSKITSFFNF
ncbi:5441_t:CDS:2 [Racocetra fulgida]|uniref:5441_t:CDS:1 n=1 Tax=Racocetra fulgida TaxID=60492 RepID=A0A9N9GSQ6_9GLOM|nr:5441_t:CDS:2 [Racocetra fulgida]